MIEQSNTLINVSILINVWRGLTLTMMTGLEDVVAFETELCLIDGEGGRLLVRGSAIDEVAGLGFERAAALLWFDDPSEERGDELRIALGRARRWAFGHAQTVAAALGRQSAMAGVRAALASLHLPGTGEHAWAKVTGALGVLLAGWARKAAGLPLLAPDPDAPHAADVLRMIHGRHEAASSRAFDHYLCTVMEHGVNASTFAARTVASTDADIQAAVLAGMCALEGRLHGGAPGPVLDMLDAVGSSERAPSWLKRELEAGRRIMGMGHRVYRARDPRAAVLERSCHTLDPESGRIALARAVEKTAERLLAERHPQRALRANVEFFTAVLLEAVGIPRDMFTATFAAGRVVGWCAHIDEQRRTGRLIRPRARYIGRPESTLRQPA